MPKQVFETSVYTREMGFTQQLAYVASGNGQNQLEYQGWADPGTATSAAKWRIMKLTYDSRHRVSTVTWAGGTDDFNQVWDDRSTLSYA